MAGGVEMMVHLRFTIQSYVDAAYAEMGIRNRGVGRCMVRIDSKSRGCYWVRVHGMCADPEQFVARLRRVALTQVVKTVELNGSKNYVIVWPK